MTDTNDLTDDENGAVEDEAAAADPPDPLAEMTAERDKLKDQLLRTAADFDNFRKRSRRDLEDTAARARDELLRELLPVIDNLERAVVASENAKDVTSVADGVRMVLKQFEDVGSRVGIERMTAVGSRFDPQIHDAVQQIESAEHDAGTIVAEVVPGYSLGGRLVRPAMVVVARPPAALPDPAEGHES